MSNLLKTTIPDNLKDHITANFVGINILLVSDNHEINNMLLSQFNIPKHQLIQVQFDWSRKQLNNLDNVFFPDLVIIYLKKIPHHTALTYLKRLKTRYSVPQLGIISDNSLNLMKEVLWIYDDIVVIPFFPEDLLFRMKFLVWLNRKIAACKEKEHFVEIRRGNRRQSDQINQKKSDDDIYYSIFRIDGKCKLIYFKNEALELGPKAYALLCLLLQNETVSHEEIAANLWPENNQNKSSEIRFYINHLRGKIENNSHHPC